jgi:hypothetical protein
MSGFGNLCRTIQARERLNEKLASVERRLAGTQWYRWRQRRSLRRRAAELQREIADRNSKISDEEVRALADNVGWFLWDKAAREIIPKANTYGPAADAKFGEIVDKALELGKDYVVCEDRSPFPLSTLPEVRALVTRSFIESYARSNIDQRAAIAASTELIHEYDQDGEGQKRLLVQHVASGLRARFFLHGDGFGGIESKSTSLDSIDPAKPGELDSDTVGRVVGLGIGRRIYEEAHRLHPDIRWGGGMLSEYSGPLRRRLHNADPYVWDWSSCRWCEKHLREQGIHHWMDAGPSSFIGHPN